ncbi:PREDICTED: teneurin-3-like [Poecilia mexicana]|uniref:teneurin-3-like n=1 Tax=Poecilia mexicana TaxID=48701 RepID=UPI00072D99D2|nr:PREDICTED: teneurin-3-like [Poecilia mexicana]XP_014837486.1 PREDICTED: teneurin-3-like [Poecilia mexicana]
MERVREQRPFCSLSKSQRERDRDCERDKDRERRYTASSTDRDNGACRVPTQKSYSSSETLQAFDHDPSRMLFGGRVKEMVHKETAEYTRPGQTFSLRQLGICEPAARRGLALCPETGLSHPLSSYTRGPAATENHEPVSPERTMTLWRTGAKSGQNSCLSSRSNSALTLTDTEMDNKSDTEMGDNLTSQQAPPPIPPAPPPHKQHPSITSLSRSSLANQRSPSPPPTAGLAADLQSTAECVQLQDSWVLGSNVALESRHFLFKTGTGTTPFFGATAPGYTMATGTVYSTPARPLPRNTLSRGAFKFKKSPKHCSWKCTALIAVAVAVVLSIILCYCIGKAQRRLQQL